MSLANINTSDFIKGSGVTQTGNVIEITGGGSGGHTIEDDGTPLTARAALNFERMIVTDDSGNDATVVTRPADTFVGTTAPSSPVEGDVWTDTNDTVWKTYVRYDSYWVERTTSGGVGALVSFLKARVTVSSAELLTLGSVPKTIIAAPGSNLFIAIHKIFVSYDYNSVAYDFSSGESPTFKWTSILAGFEIGYLDINLAGDFNMYLDSYAVSGSTNLKAPTNEALRLTTAAGTDPSVGNGDLDVIVYYTVEDKN